MTRLRFDKASISQTPAFVLDLETVRQRCGVFAEFCKDLGCHSLYSVKALSHPDIIRTVSRQLDGFSVSSLFEARLVRKYAPNARFVHFSSPGLRCEDAPELVQLCTHVSFNSHSQAERFCSTLGTTRPQGCSLGLRLNPGLSFAEDEICDPCREGSKLGIAQPLPVAVRHGRAHAGIDGVHFHNNCHSPDLGELAQTLERLLGDPAKTRSAQSPGECEPVHIPSQVRWINCGGGYLFNERQAPRRLQQQVGALKARGLDVFLEPGAGLVEAGGSLVASILDTFTSGETNVVVLDTSVNHLPEVLEYFHLEDNDDAPYPRLEEHEAAGTYCYQLTGATCLAGDIFNEYRFNSPLLPGDRVVFRNVGAYSLVKSHMFNGTGLPDIYVQNSDRPPRLAGRFDFDCFEQRLTGKPAESGGCNAAA